MCVTFFLAFLSHALTFYLACFPASILTYFLANSDFLSGMLSSIYSDIFVWHLFGTLSGICSGIRSGSLPDITSHSFWQSVWHSLWYPISDSIWPSVWHSLWHEFKPMGTPQAGDLNWSSGPGRGKRGGAGGGGGRGGGVAPSLKSRNPHRAGGECETLDFLWVPVWKHYYSAQNAETCSFWLTCIRTSIPMLLFFFWTLIMK